MIIAEIGVDLSRFATSDTCARGPGCARNSTRVPARSCRAGCATAPRGSKPCWYSARGRPTHRKNNYLHAQFLRLRARRGPKKATLAVAASILTAAYYLLRDQVAYPDLGALYFARMDQDRTAQRLARRSRELGFELQIRKAA